MSQRLAHPIAEERMGLQTFFPSQENPDWGYVRTPRAALMVPSAEWVQSVFSCPFHLNGKMYIVPNRDYPYEGLLVYQNGENWKFIDCIALSVQDSQGRQLPVVPDASDQAVRMTPWDVTYAYHVPYSALGSDEEGGIPFLVSYYLNSENTPSTITGCVELYFPQGLTHNGVDLVPTLQPFIDIRHMYDTANLSAYLIQQESDEAHGSRLHISSTDHNRILTFYVPSSVSTTVFEKPDRQHWRYKLGTGNRTESPDHQTVFIDEDKEVAAFFSFSVAPTCERKFIRIFFACSLNHPPALRWSDMELLLETSRERDSTQFDTLQKTFRLSAPTDYRKAILARIVGLTKFKVYISLPDARTEHIQVPFAGAWWFKTPWYRDVFEGILSSFETLMRIPAERENIKEIILLALSQQEDASGRILNRIPEFNDLSRSYNSSDATLLCFITANRYIAATRDQTFALQILDHAENVIQGFYREANHTCAPFCVHGSPRVDHESGLLLSVPQHSWIDTQNQTVVFGDHSFSGLPNRLSPSFIQNVYAQLHDKNALEALFSSSNFYLPEINAQWIVMLQGTRETIDFLLSGSCCDATQVEFLQQLKEQVSEILQHATQHFKSYFWNPEGFLFNAVYYDKTIRDDIACEAGITAVALLGKEFFTPEDLLAVWKFVKQRFLVYRKPVIYGQRAMMPFGVITKDDNQYVYYGDDQYHSDVIWPRCTPYLIKLLH
ncbi:MAG: amylo-alpha-1,6-glucosidase [Anaerolineae bacterium]